VRRRNPDWLKRTLDRRMPRVGREVLIGRRNPWVGDEIMGGEKFLVG
jgi:hypothetical protein